MDPFLKLTILSLAAGVLGTGIGGALGAIFADKGEKVTARVLAFAGGVMLGISAFEMAPESVECFSALGKSGALACIGAWISGAALIYGVCALVRAIGKRRGARVDAMGVVDILTEGKGDGRRMIGAGLLMLAAIALHNIPEGMAIGGAGSQELSLGVTVAIAIAVHNVPEGMAISAPLAGGGLGAGKAILLTCLAGFATVIGAILGLAIGGLGEIATGISLALSGGAMLCVTLFDIFPQSIEIGGKFPSLSVFAGVICAAGFVYLA